MASDLVVSQLKSPKFQKLIGDSAGKILGSSGSSDQLDDISRALLDEPKFQDDMKKVLDEDQKKEFSEMIPKLWILTPDYKQQKSDLKFRLLFL